MDSIKVKTVAHTPLILNDVFLSFLENARMLSQIMPQPLPSMFSPSHYIPIILSSDVLLNEPYINK
jgi:hypothetical protein